MHWDRKTEKQSLKNMLIRIPFRKKAFTEEMKYLQNAYESTDMEKKKETDQKST